jgi:type IV secretory pathway VirJ component
VDGGRLGQVRLYEPRAVGRALVFLFSDASGWNDLLEDAARALTREGAWVAGVDLAQYQRNLAASSDGCHYVVAELEALSQRLQRELGFDHYRSPILAGVGEGGTLAYAALAQAPAATLAGAASVDPAPVLRTRVALCPGAVSHAAPGGGFSYDAQPDLPGFWRVASERPLPSALAKLAARDGPILTERGDLGERLVALLHGDLSGAPPAAATPDLEDLPLVELPAEQPSGRMAVIYSGDGGWRDIDKQIGEVLAQRGVPVVGVDSLRYFWQEKAPEDVAHDLSAIMHYYGALWDAPKVLLVGYSFGAGILPFAVNPLSDADRARIAEISLLGLESRAAFEIRVEGWVGVEPDQNARLVLPELERLPLSIVQCFYGEEEDDTLCRAPELAGAEIIELSGGHHFGGDYEAVADKILAGLDRRAPPTPAAAP